jgi:radical SAM-linked protein
MASDKVRIRFRKAGDLRLVSHHDLMRCFERMLRRGAIPFHSTGGFNPKPRLVFAQSLGLGIVGCREVVELELDQPVPPEELAERLRAQSPIGLEILEVHPISPKTTAHVRRVQYRIALPEPTAELPARIAELFTRTELWVERERSAHTHVNIRRYLDAIRVEEGSLIMDLWVTPNGTAKPREVLAALGLGNLLDEGGVLERVWIELEDEAGPRPPGAPGSIAEETEKNTEKEQSETKGAISAQSSAVPEQRPQPLIQGPMDY